MLIAHPHFASETLRTGGLTFTVSLTPRLSFDDAESSRARIYKRYWRPGNSTSSFSGLITFSLSSGAVVSTLIMVFKLLAFFVVLATSASVNAAAFRARSDLQVCPWGSVLDDYVRLLLFLQIHTHVDNPTEL